MFGDERRSRGWSASVLNLAYCVGVEHQRVAGGQAGLDLGYPIKGALNLSPPITEKTHFTK